MVASVLTPSIYKLKSLVWLVPLGNMLASKTCIVAGGGRGLGKATAIELGRQGANVVVNDLGTTIDGDGASEEPVRETVEEIEAAGGTASAHFGDVTSLEYTESLVEDTVAEYGRLDGVVNFAGVLRDSFLVDMSGDEWDAVIDVHLRGHFSLLRNAAAHWRSRSKDEDGLDAQRSIVNVSSRSALGNVGQANYSAAKAGILGLTRTAAQELSRYDVRVNALMPTAYTRMIENIPEEQRPFEEEDLPPEKVAPAIGFLLSDAAEDVTGCTIRAAGDMVGIVSNPENHRIGVKDGGWTVEDLAEQFEARVAEGLDLDNSEASF
jgi:NAD(P)-dependent dehydrogenase (short-subunit alcohol dehydrogenase family)